MIDLVDTTSAEVAAALGQARRRSGTAALGLVLTFVVAAEESQVYDAVRAASEASVEHPCRIVAAIRRPGRGRPRLDAEVRAGGDSTSGEAVLLRLHGHLGEHADSVVLPLLLPDAPVVVYWPGTPPLVPEISPLGMLAQRRVTDAAASGKPLAALAERAAGHCPGDTDLAWTRLTGWRTLLAAALDLPYDRISGGEVVAARNNPSAVLLAAWLRLRLGVPVNVRWGRGPGITRATLTTTAGDIVISRPEGPQATLSRPGQADRRVALARREIRDLLAEELRRLDDDEVYGETLRAARALLPEDLVEKADAAARTAGAPHAEPRRRRSRS